MTGVWQGTPAVLLLPLHGVRLGPLRLTPYGACAAIGLLAAMALATRTARWLGVSPDTAADTGLFAVVSCFIASRLLLIVSDPRAFLHYPLVVLGLPSLTVGGMALAALGMWVYVRRKGIDLRRMLDVFAAPGAVLAACLELGHLLDRSELGMPLRLHWTSAEAFHPATPLHPVALYGVGASALLAEALWALSRRDPPPGTVAAAALLVGGVLAFGLAMVSLPEDMLTTLPLEPGQIVALGSMLSGVVLWAASRPAPARPATGVLPVSGAPLPILDPAEKR